MQPIAPLTVLVFYGVPFLVSKCDVHLVSQYTWRLWGPYVCGPTKLHQFIMGARPSNVPQDWVIDHIDRNAQNNSRLNLRWVSLAFNSWNKKTPPGSSVFRGVSWHKQRRQWFASFCGKNVGVFATERQAAVACAKAAILRWPDWAPTSDIIAGYGLLTNEEISEIQKEIMEEACLRKLARVLPTGVYLGGNRYNARHGKINLGWFSTVIEAYESRRSYEQQLHEEAWKLHLLTPVYRDLDGAAAIELSGSNGVGLSTKVPSVLWHKLTFQISWNLSGGYATGCWQGVNTRLHKVVYKLLHPEYDGKLSIDHITPEEKLNNLENNLRAATSTIQSHNRRKQPGSSKYKNVSYNKEKRKWLGRFFHDRKLYHVGYFETDFDAYVAVKSRFKVVTGFEH